MPKVRAVTRMLWFSAIYQDPKEQFPTYAIDANPDAMWPENEFIGQGVAEFKAKKNAALVGIATMRRFGWHVGQLVQLRSQLYPVTLTFQIVASFDKGPDLSLFIGRLDYLEDAIGHPVDVHLIWVRCVAMEAVSSVRAAIDEMFHNAESETETVAEKQHVATYVGFFATFIQIIEVVGIFAIGAIALTVANAAAMSTRERRKEVATLKALGYSGGEVLSAFLLENIIIAAAGGAIGVALSALLLEFVRGSSPELGPLLSFGLPYSAVAGGFAIALLTGALGCIPAALIAARSVEDGLRAIR
jgi:putative ABC transport system permease protein